MLGWRRTGLVAATGLVAIASVALGWSSLKGGDTTPLTTAELSLDEVQAVTDRWMGDCLLESGFPQLKTAQEHRTAEAVEQRGILYWNPFESGPVSDTIAASRGFLGTPDLFTESRRAEIVGDTESFDGQYQDCLEKLDLRLGESYADRMSEWFEFSAMLRHEFIAGLEPDILDLNGRLVDCIEASYPGTADSVGSFEVMLEHQGIPVGEFKTPDDQLVSDEANVQVVRVHDPIYAPTEEEVAMALAYSACADEAEFLPLMSNAQEHERDRLLVKYDQELSDWVNWSRQVAAALARNPV